MPGGEKKIYKIAKNENLRIDDKTIEVLYDLSEGDVRRAENILQSCAAVSNKIDEKSIYGVVSSANPNEIKEVLEFCVKNNFINWSCRPTITVPPFCCIDFIFRRSNIIRWNYIRVS